MDSQLEKIRQRMIQGEGLVALDEADNERADMARLGVAILLDYPHKNKLEHVKILMDQFEVTDKRKAVLALRDAEDLFPSLQKVNKELERARITAMAWKCFHECMGGDHVEVEAPNSESKKPNRPKAGFKLNADVPGAPDEEKEESEPVEKIKYTDKGIGKGSGKKNMRDAAQYLKLIALVNGLEVVDDTVTQVGVIVNQLKFDPDSLGVKMPAGFDLTKFITKLENEYARREAIDTDYEEVKDGRGK
jgi:hypothetical protein